MKNTGHTGKLQSVLAMALAATLAAGPAHAVRMRENENPPNNVPEEGPWREQTVTPPSYPREGDLIEFRPSGQTSNRFYVDGTSLSVGADKVVRFVLVVESQARAQTVSFAGLRCKTREWKDYAFANPDRSWRIDQNAQWRPIQGLDHNNYQHSLFKDYFCYGGVMSGGPAGDVKRLVRNLKYPLVQDNRNPRRYNAAPGAGGAN
jgi:hypothetical protein